VKPSVLLIVTALLASAPASAQTNEGQARTLRRAGQRATAEGRIEEAFALFRAAAEQSRDPDVWLDLGTSADRLRMDAVAVEAYQTFLERSPNAANRAEIEGRLRVLRHHIGGGRYLLGSDGHTIIALADFEGRSRGAAPAPATARQASVLVDWQGNPQVRRTTPELLSLAEWDESPQPQDRPGSSDRGERVPPPALGMGRALAAP
jgi:tetratricopeptide (TPR) repeat protein